MYQTLLLKPLKIHSVQWVIDTFVRFATGQRPSGGEKPNEDIIDDQPKYTFVNRVIFIFLFIRLLWHRVIPMPTPWVTTCNTSCTKPKTNKWTMYFKCFYGVVRACGCITAFRSAKPWRYNPLVYFNEKNKRETQYFIQPHHLLILSFFLKHCLLFQKLFRK
jgi:hypothetical protein